MGASLHTRRWRPLDTVTGWLWLSCAEMSLEQDEANQGSGRAASSGSGPVSRLLLGKPVSGVGCMSEPGDTRLHLSCSDDVATPATPAAIPRLDVNFP